MLISAKELKKILTLDLLHLGSSVVWTTWEDVEALAATMLFPAFFLFSTFVNVSIVPTACLC